MKDSLVELLRNARIAKGFKQKDVAYRLGIKDNTLSNWETGRTEPDMDTFLELCDIYGIDAAKALSDAYGGASSANKNTPSLSDEALKIAHDYSDLDQPGKNVVKVVISEEGKRVQAERLRRQQKELWSDDEDESGDHSDPRLIPLYFVPAAAGLASPAFGEDFEYIEIGGDVPAHADFAVKIDGDSMEPYIMDGSTAYVNREPLENGDVGLFFVDGDMLCKQYYKDEKGNVRLLSLNRARSDADRFIHRNGDTAMTCYGRVILQHRPKISLL